MGVYGLWRLLDATGKQVPLETLQGKVLAIDISIWIHQVLQGYQDRFGNPKPNAHLIGLFHRICKLLYYKIKPVFVFDGGVPMLKKDTIASRRKQKSMAKNKAQQMKAELINNLIKHSTVKKVLNTERDNTAKGSSEIVVNLQTKQTVDDMFKLPDLPSTSKTDLCINDEYNSDSSVELNQQKQTKWIGNIHNVDVNCAEFKALPADVRYNILTDLKETRKQSSWGRLHEMPEESNEFSGFQMKRLLKRRLIQKYLECAEKEMGGKTLTLDELDKLLKEQGVTTDIQNYTYRIAADNTTRLLYISDKNTYIKSNNPSLNGENIQDDKSETDETVAGPSKDIPIVDDINEYELSDDYDSDYEAATVNDFKFIKETSSDSETELNELRSKKCLEKNIVNPARAYMLEYSGLTEKQILTVLNEKNKVTYEDTENFSKIEQRSDSFETQHCDNKSDLSDTHHLISLPDDNASKTEFFKLNSERNVNVSPLGIANISNKAQAETESATVITSTDSESGDFIEIEDAPISNMDINVNKCILQQNIQITFKTTDEKIEDDIFADVFEVPNSELNTEVHSQAELSKQSLSAVKFDGIMLRNKIAAEEMIAKSSSLSAEIDLSSACTNSNLEEIQVEDKNNTEYEAISLVKDNAEAGNIENSTRDRMSISSIPTDEDELLYLKAQLEERQNELMVNIGKLERQGIDISDQIRIEAQELLQLFGIPYIVAPMEAEAQCAYLEQIHLTDGTITDDSDIWLFGGQCVYKNFFDNNKKVLEFRSCDIHHHFKLTRNELIRLALLVGSDYTTGLTGIGPVTALEILAAFPSQGDDLLQGLTNFCSWIETGRVAGPGKTALRNKLQNLQIQKGFPSQAVVQAYLFPKVDESRETFSWGKPNTILLADYTKKKFGWDKNKYNEIMIPVLKRLEEKQIQSKISTYFKLQTVPKSIEVNLSKRVQKALQQLNKPTEDSTEEDSTCIESVRQTTKKGKSSIAQRKEKRKPNNEQTQTDHSKPKILNVASLAEKNTKEYIPQREKDKLNTLKNKLHAIEVLRKSKQGLYKTKKVKRCVRKVKQEAELSESDSDNS
ncbi:rad2 superfamily protein mus201 [Xylocopa sonorina]|uniref:rad2 superfamily protein mus201 n=1 Tax=Xylocopa sonorina TaxID=1818115 RepID=UPI00403AA627